LHAWEAVLKSQVAVSLVLLGVLLGVLRWCYVLHRENRELNTWVREHLQAQGDFGVVLDHVRQAMALRAGGPE
jgi:hypothetical protein